MNSKRQTVFIEKSKFWKCLNKETFSSGDPAHSIHGLHTQKNNSKNNTRKINLAIKYMHFFQLQNLTSCFYFNIFNSVVIFSNINGCVIHNLERKRKQLLTIGLIMDVDCSQQACSNCWNEHLFLFARIWKIFMMMMIIILRKTTQ